MKGELISKNLLNHIFAILANFFLILKASDWAAHLSQPIRSLQILKKFTKKAKTLFDEFFENISPLVGIFFLNCVFQFLYLYFTYYSSVLVGSIFGTTWEDPEGGFINFAAKRV